MIRFGHGHYPGSTVDRLFSPAYVPVCNPALLAATSATGTPGPALAHPDPRRHAARSRRPPGMGAVAQPGRCCRYRGSVTRLLFRRCGACRSGGHGRPGRCSGGTPPGQCRHCRGVAWRFPFLIRSLPVTPITSRLAAQEPSVRRYSPCAPGWCGKQPGKGQRKPVSKGRKTYRWQLPPDAPLLLRKVFNPMSNDAERVKAVAHSVWLLISVAPGDCSENGCRDAQPVVAAHPSRFTQASQHKTKKPSLRWLLCLVPGAMNLGTGLR